MLSSSTHLVFINRWSFLSYYYLSQVTVYVVTKTFLNSYWINTVSLKAVIGPHHNMLE